MKTRLLPFVLVTLCATLAGCARNIEVGSAPREVYTLDVSNETPESMIVSYNDGRGDAVLGSVAPARTERFIIAAPARLGISVTGTSAASGRTSGPHTVQLTAGQPQRVRLR